MTIFYYYEDKIIKIINLIYNSINYNLTNASIDFVIFLKSSFLILFLLKRVLIKIIT